MKMSNMELITLLMCDGTRKNVWVDLKDTQSITIKIIDKNEIMIVTKLNGEVEEYDYREVKQTNEVLNGEYYIYLPEHNINCIDMFNVECSSLDLLHEYCMKVV